jgi:muramoyltetrapeptide carboxypeptidase
MIVPPYLKTGDRIRVVAPSGKVSQRRCEEGIVLLEEWGLKVERGDHLYDEWGLFAGNDKARLSDLQGAIDDRGVRAIFCARGGYGLSRIIDRIDYSELIDSPKWIVGYSDITALHLWVNMNYGIASIHGEMVAGYRDPRKTAESLDTLRESLFNGSVNYKWSSGNLVEGEASGIITGGNLSLICTLSGSEAGQLLKNKILVIEDTGEYLYRLDRMLTDLKLSGILENLQGMVVGDMTRMVDSDTPFGKGWEEIIMDAVSGYGYPVATGLPVGHSNDNRALTLGSNIVLKVQNGSCEISYT